MHADQGMTSDLSGCSKRNTTSLRCLPGSEDKGPRQAPASVEKNDRDDACPKTMLAHERRECSRPCLFFPIAQDPLWQWGGSEAIGCKGGLFVTE
eukprot:2808627-Rhodomonas_salina.2